MPVCVVLPANLINRTTEVFLIRLSGFTVDRFQIKERIPIHNPIDRKSLTVCETACVNQFFLVNVCADNWL